METNTENWKDHLQKGGSLMIVILGNILYALAVKLFLMPAGLQLCWHPPVFLFRLLMYSIHLRSCLHFQM